MIKNAILILIVAPILFALMWTTPVRQSLRCEPSGDGVECARVRAFALRKISEMRTIPDPSTIRLWDEPDMWSDASRTKFYIEGADASGARVILWDVPETDTGYATELARRMRRLEAGAPPVEFERSYYGTFLILFGAIAAFAAAIAFLSDRKGKR